MAELPLIALRAFASVYAHGGVRPAARELGIAHSSVSRHLTELQRWLGVELVRAGGGRRPLAFTAQGETLGKAATSALGDLAQAVSAVRESRSARSVTVATAPSFAVRWLLPRLPDFERAFPRLELSVLVDRRREEPEAGVVDFAVRIGAGPWPGLRCEPLLDDLLYPVMSPSYWQRAGRPRDPARLSRLRLLHDRDPHASWQAWRRTHGPPSLDVSKGPRFTSSDLVLRAAAQGQGVALARHRLAADDVAAGVLVRPFGERSVEIGPSYWLVLPPAVALGPAAVTALGWLRRQAALDASSTRG
jgi:LysR family transcriptional regulator, glycine cleavage system transcriptional activator